MIEDEVPRKWLDKKQYVRIDPSTGSPQLIRVEPVVTESGELVPDRVAVFVDDDMTLVERRAAEKFIQELDCIPMEKLQRGQKENG